MTIASEPQSAGPLDGVTIADFSRVLAGPLATMMLGDLGANVIKIERDHVGDDTRAWGPPFTTQGDSAYYLAVNRNKRRIALDLGDEQQLETARRIALSSDVVIENFRAGTMERFGLDYDSLAKHEARLIYCRISGFGNKAGRDLPGYDFLAQALGGLMSITGEPERPPMKTGVAIVDILAGLHATIGILAALNERQVSGRGQAIEVNLFSSALASLANQASSYLTTGTIPKRQSNQHPSIAPYETFSTAGEPIVIAVGNDSQFRKLCVALQDPEIADDSRWKTNGNRVANRAALIVALTAILETNSHEYWLTRLKANDVPCAPVNNIAEAFDLAQKLGLDAIQNHAQLDDTTIATVSNPIDFSRTPVSYRHAPPKLGEDSEEILDELGRRPGG